MVKIKSLEIGYWKTLQKYKKTQNVTRKLPYNLYLNTQLTGLAK